LLNGVSNSMFETNCKKETVSYDISEYGFEKNELLKSLSRKSGTERK
jgi:hypothetical protein